jgi:hypothetical protein
MSSVRNFSPQCCAYQSNYVYTTFLLQAIASTYGIIFIMKHRASCYFCISLFQFFGAPQIKLCLLLLIKHNDDSCVQWSMSFQHPACVHWRFLNEPVFLCLSAVMSHLPSGSSRCISVSVLSRARPVFSPT